MTLVSGPLSTVTTTPSAVSQVNISINSPRTRGTGVMTPEVKTVAVTGGDFSSQIAPGPAVLTLLIGGRESVPIPILVGDVESQTLANAVNAAKVATSDNKEWLEKLAAEVIAGTQGPMGEPGPAGPKGDPGDKGDPGATGSLDLIDESVQTTIDTVVVPAIEGARDEALGQVDGAVGSALSNYFLPPSTNLFDIDDAEDGWVLPAHSGTPVVNSSHMLTGLIPVVAEQMYTWVDIARVSWHTGAEFVSSVEGTVAGVTKQFAAPTTATHVRLSVNKNYLATAQFNAGPELLPYEPGGSGGILPEKLPQSLWFPLTAEDVGAQPAGDYLEGAVSPEKTTFFESSSNLFNPTGALVDMVIPSGSGTPIPSESWSVSTPIPVTGGAQYTYAGALRLTWLAGSTYVSTVNAPGSLTGTVTAPTSATHVRLSYRTSGQATVQLNAGAELLPYEPGGSGTMKIPARYLNIEGITPGGGGGSDITTADPFIIDTSGLEEIYTAPIIPAQPDLPDTYPADVYGWWDQLVTDHPEYVTRRDLGLASDGVTPMYAYTLRPQEVPTHVSGSVDPGLASPLPCAMLIAGTHGYEEAGVYHLWRLAKALCEEWETSPVLDAMRWNFEIVAVPLVNPVGWTPGNGGRHNANGVDLARNFDADWRPPTAEVPSGSAPLSEPEAQAVDGLMQEVADRCVLGSSFHNFSATAERPWLTMWQAAPTPMMLNLGKRLIARMSRKWRAEHTWVTVPETYFGYADRGAPFGSEGRAFVAHGIPGSTFETTQRLFLDGGAGVARSSDAMTCGYEATVNYVAMGIAEGIRLKG